MLNNIIKNIQKKSLKERFLLVMGILLFLAYLVLGLIFIFLKSLPIAMPPKYRLAFGVVLIVYSFIRLFRVYNANNE
jgi:uncharacterized membrane protein HdeD (DUF308 family)